MERNKGYRKYQRERAINKKLNIIKCTWYTKGLELDRKFIGKLDKGKVHCSCWMCSTKRKNWGPKDKEMEKLKQMKKDINQNR